MGVISFPHLGNYYVPIRYLLSKVTDHEIREAPPITRKTIELGTLYSPEFVCTPFKYNLGNFIEALENGATILIQAGGGCRFGYYAEVQQQILKDMGYSFEFYSLTDDCSNSIKSIFQVIRKLNSSISVFKILYYLILIFYMMKLMEKMDVYIRTNIGFEIETKMERYHQEMLKEFSRVKGFFSLTNVYFKYRKMIRTVPLRKPVRPYRVAILGELYACMEPFSSYYIEKALGKMGVEVTRYTTVTYLLIVKRFITKKLLRMAKGYCKYPIGADGLDNVAHAVRCAKKGYEGLIHIKPFSCTPEISAMPILKRVHEDFHIPILYFTFDANTGEEGIKTRLEAFYEMIQMRREQNE